MPHAKIEAIESKIDKILMGQSAEKASKIGDWISEQETQEILGLKKTSLWYLRKTKKLTYSKVGAKIFYSLKSIEKLLNKNQI